MGKIIGNDWDHFLHNFFDFQINFLGNSAAQQESWGQAKGEKFGWFLILFYQDWEIISNNFLRFKLTEFEFRQLEKLFKMIDEFSSSYPHPTKPEEYQLLFINPDWKRIQETAKNLYLTIAPRLRSVDPLPR